MKHHFTKRILVAAAVVYAILAGEPTGSGAEPEATAVKSLVRGEVEATVAEAARRDPFLSNNPPEVVYHGFQAEGYVLGDGGPEAQGLLEKCHRTAFGAALEREISTATTDARFFGLYAGIPALVYGPTAADIHGFDEKVDLDSVRRVTQAIALFVADWCGLEAAA